MAGWNNEDGKFGNGTDEFREVRLCHFIVI